jgi:hypothetical protein
MSRTCLHRPLIPRERCFYIRSNAEPQREILRLPAVFPTILSNDSVEVQTGVFGRIKSQGLVLQHLVMHLPHILHQTATAASMPKHKIGLTSTEL